jgi:hypothetical protein
LEVGEDALIFLVAGEEARWAFCRIHGLPLGLARPRA